jgi:hypothetical protein
MTTCVDLQQYLARSFLGREIYETKIVQKTKTQILSSVVLFVK